MFSPNVLRYGSETPLSEQRSLRAGPLTMIYEAGDLRSIRYGEREIVRRIYVAVRDHNWGTVPAVLSDVEMDVRDESFRMTYTATHQQGTLDFRWHGTISGDADGALRFTLDGRARTTFLRNRIGFCVLHPSDLAGTLCVVEHVDGSTESAMLPNYIVSDQPVMPFAELRGLSHEAGPNVTATMRFEGDIFEMEDQRNWTDASYKTFCTPLRLPYPVEVPEGAAVRQAVTLTLQDKATRRQADNQRTATAISSSSPVLVSLSDRQMPLPPIGLGVASHGQLLTKRAIERLRALCLSHLRVDLVPQDALEAKLVQAGGEAQALGVPLEIAVMLPDAPGETLRAIRAVLDAVRPNVARWLVYPVVERFRGGVPMGTLVRMAHAQLADYAPTVPFVAGTNADLILLQRNMPPIDKVDGVCYAINPQVHAFDNASLVETLAAQAFTVKTAQHVAPDKQVIVSPVTFKPRANYYVAVPPQPTTTGELPLNVDVRQMSLFGAGWTLGSVKYLAQSGAASLTYYETSGWRGVMETEQGSPEPTLFRSLPGAVFPLYHVLADIGAFAGGSVIATTSSDALRCDALALHKDGRTRVLVANLSAASQQVNTNGLNGTVRVVTLTETNVLAAMQEPEAFRSAPDETMDAHGLTLTLAPYALARIDSA